LSWFEHGGSRIYYEESGSGESVLLLPGWGGTIDELAPLRSALEPKFRVIAADVPGSGKSGPQPRDYSASYYHDDAKSFLALLDHLGASPAHLVGFSDGGEYELVMASSSPAAARSLVTWGACGKVEAPAEMFEMMANLVDAPPPPMAEFSEYLKGAYGVDNARHMTKSASTAWAAISEAGGDVARSRAGNIICPALLITGENDFLASPVLVSDFAGAVPGGEFVEVKGASHAIHHEQPELLWKLIVDWLGNR
jgi:valacyclovir hydrolase